MGTIRKHGDKWRAWVDRPRGPDGNRARASKVFPTQTAAKAWVRAEETARDRGEAVAPDRRTLASLAADWIAAREHELRPKTVASYRGSLDLHVLPHLGDRRVQDLTEQDVARWVAKLRATGVGARSVQMAKLRLDQVLDLAVDWTIVPRNVARRVKVTAPPARTADVWSLDDLRRFLAAADDDPAFPLWHVAAATGLRRGELLGLRWADLDLDAAVLRVAQQVIPVPGGLAIGPPKSRAALRSVALPSWLPPLLRAHKDRQAFAKAKTGDLWRDLDLVFPSRVGTPQNPNNLYPDLNRLMARAGVPRITWHQIRHTHVTQAIAAGVPIGVVSKRVGHARTSITLDIYAHVLGGQDRAAADAIGDLLAPATGPDDGEAAVR